METNVRTASWNNLGVDVSKSKNVEEVLRSSDLDYNVCRADVNFNVNGNVYTMPNRVITYREDNPERTFGVVTKDYQICQNRDAFEFINSIEADMNFLKAGETRDGRVYIISELPAINVLGDAVRPHLIFQNGHNGIYPVQANISMLRIVCQNQFNASFEESANTIKIRHSSNMSDKLLEARKTLADTYQYIANYKNFAERMAGKKLTNSVLQDIIKEMLLIKEEEKISRSQEAKKELFTSVYNNDDNQNFKGTAWGVINAWTDFSTHLPQYRKSDSFEESRFIKNTFQSNELDKLVKLIEAA